MTAADAAPDWAALQAAIAGDVVPRGEPGYDRARMVPIARHHHVRPAAVVRPRSPDDVAQAIALARRSALPLAARSGGHCFAGGSSTGGIVVDVTEMASVSVAEGTATVGAGARLGDIYDALDAGGLTIAAGCGPTVGIAGLTLGGGLGLLGRSHGLTCDSLLAAEVVLADGRVVRCDAGHDAELLWALRGSGGATFGVVTALVLRTLPAPRATSLEVTWPAARAAAVLDAWQRWAVDGPVELAASLLLSAPADPDAPPAVTVIGAMLAGEADAADAIGDLVAAVGADPTWSALGEDSFREVKRHLAGRQDDGDPSGEHGHAFSRSEFFRRPLPADAIAALVAHLADERRAGQARELDLSPWGGAYNRVAEDATAFAHRGERFLVKHAAVVDAGAPAVEHDAARRWATRSWASLRPWGSGRVYPNFPDPDLHDAPRAYWAGNLERLARAAARYDPDGFFGFPAIVR